MKRYLVLFSIILLSLLVRISVPPNPDYMHGIWDTYRQLGLSIASGHGYVLADGNVPLPYYTPGYAYLWALGIPSLAVVLDGILGPVLLYLTVKGHSGLIAAAFYALAMPIARIVTYQMPDSLTSILSLMAVCPVLIWRRGAILSGLMLGIALWFRSDFMALVPLLALAILIKFGWRNVLLFAAGWIGPALALGLFFWSVYGTFSFTRSGIGVNLWEGLGEYANPWGIVTDDLAAAKLLSTNGLQYGTSAGDVFLQTVYLNDFKQRPTLVIGQIAQRFVHNLTLQGGWYTDNILFIVLVGLSMISFYINRSSPITWAFGALWLSRMIPFSIMHTEVRYVIPIIPVYIVGLSLLTTAAVRVRVSRAVDLLAAPLMKHKQPNQVDVA